MSIANKIAALRQHHSNLSAVIYDIGTARVHFEFGPGFNDIPYQLYTWEQFEPRSESARFMKEIEDLFNGEDHQHPHFAE
jgi:hypothetical protein